MFLCSYFTASEDVLVAEVPVAFLKKELKVEETPMPATPPPTLPSSPSSAAPGQAQSFSAEEDFLPGTASLMSTQRGRGRPRKIKPEVELHLRTAKIRRQRRSSIRSVGGDKPGSPSGTTQDLTQAAFQSWLSQSQEAATCSAAGEAPEGNRPERSVKEMAEKQGQWFNLLPKQPCDENSLTEAQIPASPPKLLPQVQDVLATVSADLIKVCSWKKRLKRTVIIHLCNPETISSHSRILSCPSRFLLSVRTRRRHRKSTPLMLLKLPPH